jgi:hypothetical protein
MHKALFVGLCRFSYFCPDYKRWCWGGRSRTSSVLIICQSKTRPATSLRPPLVASPTASVGDLAMVESPASEESTSEARGAPISVTPRVDGTSQGTACVEVDGAGPQQSDDVRGLMRDLVKRAAAPAWECCPR